MRMRIKVYGATTDELRKLAAAASRAAGKQLTNVGCDGPEMWVGETQPVDRRQAEALLRFYAVELERGGSR